MKGKLFLRHIGQTSPSPMMIDVERAEDIYLYAPDGTQYIDLISGVAVSNVGHSNKKVIDAVCEQAQKYMHLMVYGEYIQSAQTDFVAKLVEYLPSKIDSVYLVNSGSEAIEGSMKLAKRATGRTEIISFKNAYHGSTHGALSIQGSEDFKYAFRPLLPDTRLLNYNNFDDLKFITSRTAAVVTEVVQGEAGFIVANKQWIDALRAKCNEVGALLIFDEVQTGFGRTGNMFASETLGVEPDLIAMAKAMGGGMPLGGFAASKELMDKLTYNPVLGHITTFGGHPVSCAAALAAMNFLLDEKLIEAVDSKSKHFLDRLSKLSAVKEIRSCGLMIAVDLGDSALRDKAVNILVSKGILTEGFLFCETAFRIAPPLIITDEQIDFICDQIVEVLENL
ncbi:MAG: aspartate aminotransferase family protein [Rikenellaceae bacterium]